METGVVKLKIFVDAHVFDGIHQGTVTFIAGLYKEILKNKNIQLFVGSNDYNLAVKFLDSTNFIHIKYKNHSKLKRLAFDIPIALWKYKVDYAHFQYIAPVIKSCKYIVTIHDLLFLDYPDKFPLFYRVQNTILFYFTAKRADILTTVSNYSKESIHKHFHISKSKIIVTPNAVSKEIIEPKPFDQLINKKFILYVSRIEPRKNQLLLLKAWVDLKLYESDIHLVFVGSIGIKDLKFEDEIKNLNVVQLQHFHWLKNISKENLIWFYKNCKLFVYPSEAEGFGIPPIEAAFHGAKVICSNNSAMVDFDFFKELWFSPYSINELKEKITEALNSNNNSIVEIKNEIDKKYDWSIISNYFIDYLNYKSIK